MAGVVASCAKIPDTRAVPIKHLSSVLRIDGETDEWGEASRFVHPASVVRELVARGLIPVKTPPNGRGAPPPMGGGNATRPLYAVNFGARDGRGEGGNSDPTWPLFKDMGFHGMAVEASPVFQEQLGANMGGLPVATLSEFITVHNAVSLIEAQRPPAVDVFKIDIDSFDCDVIPLVLRAYRPAVVIAEVNVYFPPPLKMRLLPSPLGFNNEERGNVYECSAQHMDDEVMRPLGYSLLQMDWQNVMYARDEVAAAIGMGGGVDVQAAYHQGYAAQPRRLAHFPWGLPLEHLLHCADYGGRAAAAIEWARASEHRQREGVSLGCGGSFLTMRFGRPKGGDGPPYVL